MVMTYAVCGVFDCRTTSSTFAGACGRSPFRRAESIAEIGAAGEVNVEIAGTFPLAGVAKAHELSEAGHVRGKLILTVS
jgi:NADPH:quinone reductase-like Zn-dependent oxidoreductase